MATGQTSAGGGGGGNAVVTGRVDGYGTIVYGETDNGIINFDYSTDYNVRLGSMLVCYIDGAYTEDIPSGLERVGVEGGSRGSMVVFKVTGNFTIDYL